MTVVLGEKQTAPTFKEGEIWWCSIGMNIGREVFGKGKDFARPVFVFKKLDRDSFLAIPLTTQQKSGSWYVPIFYNGVESRAILSQIRILDKKRLIKQIGTLSYKNSRYIKERFIKFYSS
jgi:mRNA interferase MazF